MASKEYRGPQGSTTISEEEHQARIRKGMEYAKQLFGQKHLSKQSSTEASLQAIREGYQEAETLEKRYRHWVDHVISELKEEMTKEEFRHLRKKAETLVGETLDVDEETMTGKMRALLLIMRLQEALEEEKDLKKLARIKKMLAEDYKSL